MTNNSNEKDILALEAMSELKNYNSYTFKLIADSITSKKVLDFGSGYGVFCEYLQDKNYDEATLAIVDLLQKGKDIKYHEIDEYINKFGKNELIKNFVKNYYMTKIFDNSDELKFFKDFKEEKKRA